MSAAYAIFHGPTRLYNIANNIHHKTRYLKKALEKLGFKIISKKYFDTLLIKSTQAKYWVEKSINQGNNFRLFDKNHFTISLDETTTSPGSRVLTERNVGTEDRESNTATGISNLLFGRDDMLSLIHI